MKLIICLDDENGMLFNQRRQSQDQALRSRIMELTAGSKLWMDEYSAGQFEENDSIVVDDQFMEHAPDSDFCFAEKADLLSVTDRVTTLVIYRWNRRYPSDVKAPAVLLERCCAKVSTFEFVGSSHERITEEVYCL